MLVVESVQYDAFEDPNDGKDVTIVSRKGRLNPQIEIFSPLEFLVLQETTTGDRATNVCSHWHQPVCQGWQNWRQCVFEDIEMVSLV